MIMTRMWYGIGFTIIPFFVLVLGYLNVHPELYRKIPSNFSDPQSSETWSIDWNDEEDKKNPPLEFLSSNHKPLNVWTEVKTITSFWDLWNTPKSELEYEWEYKVKNLTDKKRAVTVTYKLVDKNDNELNENSKTETIEPEETITIKHTSRIEYELLHLVKGGGWSINHRETF